MAQEKRPAAAKAEAQEHARRAEQEEQERAEIHARATAMLDEIKGRLAERLAPLALSSARAVRRYPDGSVEAVEITTEHNV